MDRDPVYIPSFVGSLCICNLSTHPFLVRFSLVGFVVTITVPISPGVYVSFPFPANPSLFCLCFSLT